jgi:hypothetical protein
MLDHRQRGRRAPVNRRHDPKTSREVSQAPRIPAFGLRYSLDDDHHTSSVRAILLLPFSIDTDLRLALVEISRSRKEPANRVERARTLLIFLDDPSD